MKVSISLSKFNNACFDFLRQDFPKNEIIIWLVIFHFSNSSRFGKTPQDVWFTGINRVHACWESRQWPFNRSQVDETVQVSGAVSGNPGHAVHYLRPAIPYLIKNLSIRYLFTALAVAVLVVCMHFQITLLGALHSNWPVEHWPIGKLAGVLCLRTSWQHQVLTGRPFWDCLICNCLRCCKLLPHGHFKTAILQDI